jgi:peptidoglycan hydrolase CwlO-like protein
VLSTGSYPVTITWETINSRSTTFTVTTTPTIALGVSNGVAGAVVTITGSGFSGNADITLYFGTTVVNSTAMDSNFTQTTAGGDLAAGLTFVVPTLTPATYAVSVVDEYGATSASGVFFTIEPTPVTTIALRGTTYYPMDIFSFNIYTTEPSLGTINVTIRDPAGMVWWTTTDWTLTDFGAYRTVIYQNQGADDYNQMRMVLPADAPIGAWNWTITYTPTSTGMLTKATGLFNVVATSDMLDTIIEGIDDLTDMLDALDGDVNAIQTTLTSVDSKVSSISGDMASIETSLGSVETSLSNLDATITGLDGDIATISTSLGTVQTSISSLDATLDAVAGDTATIATISTSLGDIEGTITDMDGTIATIETDLGTVRMDVADLKADVASVQADVDESLPVSVDMMPVWIAVVLSLIAAIAAIFAVITIRQKIAG